MGFIFVLESILLSFSGMILSSFLPLLLLFPLNFDMMLLMMLSVGAMIVPLDATRSRVQTSFDEKSCSSCSKRT